jgi:hypothetical protein
MLRGVLFLLFVVVVAAVICARVRRAGRRRYKPSSEPSATVVEVSPPALPAPPSTDGPALTSAEVLHKLNELAFARELPCTSYAHGEVVAGVAS